MICYAFNNPGEKCAGNCGKLHVCQVCDGPENAHPFTLCPLYLKALAEKGAN